MKAKRVRGEFHVSAIEVAKGDLLWHYTESDTDIATCLVITRRSR